MIASAGTGEHDTQFTALLAATTAAHGSVQATEMLRDLGFAEQAQDAAGTLNAPDSLKIVAQDVQALSKA